MKTISYVIFIILFSLLSCSTDECSSIIEPAENEFTANCNRYKTPLARIRKSSDTGIVSFANYLSDSANNSTSDETNINVVSLWIVFPEGSQNGIPTGNYTLKSQNTEKYILNSCTVIIGASLDYPLYVDYEHLYSDFKEITLNVSNNQNIYTINYTLVTQNNIKTKGKYVGEVRVVPWQN